MGREIERESTAQREMRDARTAPFTGLARTGMMSIFANFAMHATSVALVLV